MGENATDTALTDCLRAMQKFTQGSPRISGQSDYMVSNFYSADDESLMGWLYEDVCDAVFDKKTTSTAL